MDDLFNIMGDMDIKAARINVNGPVAVIDNVKKVIIMSDTNITVDHGKGQLSLYGTNLNVEYIYDGRIRVSGKFDGIEFFGNMSATITGRRVTAPKENSSASKSLDHKEESTGKDNAI